MPHELHGHASSHTQPVLCFESQGLAYGHHPWRSKDCRLSGRGSSTHHRQSLCTAPHPVKRAAYTAPSLPLLVWRTVWARMQLLARVLVQLASGSGVR